MKRTLKSLFGLAVLGKDGDAGSVLDFFMDDRDWTVRCMVAGITGMLAGEHRVVISSEAFRFPGDAAGRAFPVALTSEQIRKSPELDFAEPITSGQQEALAAYYREPSDENRAAVYSASGLMPAGPAPRDDYILLSLRELARYHVRTLEGESGAVRDVVVEDADWTVSYLVADTGGLLGKKILISPHWIERVETPYSEVQTRLRRQALEESPAFDPHLPITRDYEDLLSRHFGAEPGHDGDRK